MYRARSPLVTLFLLTTLGMGLVACETYDPPPEVDLTQPEGGAFVVGSPVNVTFTEEVDVNSLQVRIWPDTRNKEGLFDDDVKPLVEACTPGDCGDKLKATLGEDGKSLQLEFDPMSIGKAGSTVYLEILPGLMDKDKNDTGVSQFFTLSFKLSDDNMRVNEEPVPFDQGTYILVGEIAEPIPAVMNLVGEVRVNKDGTFALSMAEGDHIDGAPKNTSNPDELYIDAGDTGFAVHISGFVYYRDGERLLETDPTNVAIPLGFLDVDLKQVRLNGKIVKNPETGKDRIEANLSFEDLDIIRRGKVTPYPGSSTALAGDWVAPEKAPEGHPKVCGDTCGVVTGTCNVPEEFPPMGVCDEE